MNELRMEIMTLLTLFFTSPGFALWLGVMISVAVFLGYFVFDDFKKVRNWLLVFVIYLIFQELMRASYFSVLPQATVDPFRPVFLVMISGFLFGIGLTIGGWISYNTKKRRACIRAKADMMIENIKTNGTIDPSKEISNESNSGNA